jgi:hypothetical protein
MENERAMGPVDYLLSSYPGTSDRGTPCRLIELVDLEVLRVLDLLIVIKSK